MAKLSIVFDYRFYALGSWATVPPICNLTCDFDENDMEDFGNIESYVLQTAETFLQLCEHLPIMREKIAEEMKLKEGDNTNGK